ncbi:MAG: peptidylprolyl isomerase [Armatimonadetes bacterium]|nr:peptidylprolyl isomerase [Armatimonadota bacterium]
MFRRHGSVHAALALAALAATGAALGQAKPASKPAAAPKPPAPDVVAVVNGERITRGAIAEQLIADQVARISALDERYADRARPVAAAVGSVLLKQLAGPKARRQVTVTRAAVEEALFDDKSAVVKDAVQNWIREIAIRQAAKQAGVTPKAPEATAAFVKAVDTARKQLNLTGMSDAKVLATLGYRSETIRRGVDTSLCLEGMVRKDLEAKMGHKLSASDYVDARHILIRVSPPPPTVPQAGQPAPPAPDMEKLFAEAKTKIDAIAADIAAGRKTFEKSATELSDDGTKFKEGKLDVFVRGQMDAEFEKAAFTQEVGKVGAPVRSQFGWHLIRVDRPGKEIPSAERDQAWQNYMRSKAPATVSGIMKKSKITNFIDPTAPIE